MKARNDGASEMTKGVLENVDRALKLKDFADLHAIEQLAQSCGVTPATVVKDFSTFRDFLLDKKILGYCQQDTALICVSGWGYRFIRAVKRLRKEKCKSENILAEALSMCLSQLLSDHENVHRVTTAQEEMIDLINQTLKAALSEARTVTQEILLQKRENEFVVAELERSEKRVNVLKKLISTMTLGQIRERESLLNQLTDDGLGEFTDLTVL